MNQTSQTPKPAPAPAPPVPRLVDDKYGTVEQIRALKPAALVAVLNDSQASVYAKAKACQRLAVTGDAGAVPALKALLLNPHLSHYARTALEPNPAPEAATALRDVLGQLKGVQLIGVINSIGVRRDRLAIEPLVALMADADVEVVKAATAALARVRPPL
jgi:HEAT repeat protein